MGDLLAALVPEMLGLIATPAAVVGCVLLLESKRPLAGAASFAGGFLAQYVLLAVAALVGSADRVPVSQDGPSVKSWLGLGVGIVLFGMGIVILLRPQNSQAPPKWTARLEEVRPRGAFFAGVGLSIVNPNVFILLSGMSIITASEVTAGQQAVAAALLVAACALDFVVPIGVYLGLGERARPLLAATRDWMIRHNKALTVVVLLGFGVLFVVRGIRAMTS